MWVAPRHWVARGQGAAKVLTPALCPAGAAALEQLAVGAGSFCNVCQIVITYFDNELLKNETLAELSDMLEKGCELLPPPLTDKVSRGGGHRTPPGAPQHPVAGLTPSLLPSVRRLCYSMSQRLCGSSCR